MENNIIYTTNEGNRVCSTYADIYSNDYYDGEKSNNGCGPKTTTKKIGRNQQNDVWTSPSDLLMGILKLKPPFTSKITRGKTHEGILTIGNDVLETKQAKFLEQLNTQIHENDAAWQHILEHEKAFINKKVKEVYETIFIKNTKLMSTEIASFYKKSLQELENHLRSEVQNVLINIRAEIINDLNFQIKKKLFKEKNRLERILKTKYNAEEKKVKKYYDLLLQNELHRHNTLIYNAVLERNEAIRAFLQQLEMKNITNTMYVMCTERKKCKIKRFMLQNYQDTEIGENIKKLMERKIVMDSYKNDNVRISDINRDWEQKIKKILQLFLKFISFSLKLLPEQATFLMDFEKMVVLQLNEIIQKPQDALMILIDKENFDNTFKFDNLQPDKSVCDTEPIIITGTLEDLPPTRYGSRETLPSDVDLPTIRLQRQFIYAKCYDFKEIKNVLDKLRCKCRDVPKKAPSHTILVSELTESITSNSSHISESSNEPLLVNDINRLYECPVSKCKDWGKRYSFPDFQSYLDFTEGNFQRVHDILGKPSRKIIMPELLDPKSIILTELPFSATKECFNTVGTQYSSQENSCTASNVCTCFINAREKQNELPGFSKDSDKKYLNKMLMQRRDYIKKLLHENTTLLKMFTDESFNLVM